MLAAADATGQVPAEPQQVDGLAVTELQAVLRARNSLRRRSSSTGPRGVEFKTWSNWPGLSFRGSERGLFVTTCHRAVRSCYFTW
jgi:hypothetical protein